MRTMTFLSGVLLATAIGAQEVDTSSVWEHPFETDDLREPALETGGNALVTNVTIHSAVTPAEVGDVLVLDGRIEAIGTGLTAPDGVVVVDGTGKHLAPGAVDTHSHMAIERGINEGTLSITADCDITDVINADDVALYRALAGGTTTIQCLHGSANTIGGRSEVLKLRWHVSADELRFRDAPQGIKFALGENVKQSNWGRRTSRFPSSRMGVESVFHRAFMRAQEYRAEWQRFHAATDAGDDPSPPRRDVRLDVLVGILEGDVNVHSHCYRADEILMLLRTAEHYGFRVRTLQHVLEGYKVAFEIAEHGAMPSTFSDWWAYKIEAYDAVPQNAALMDEAGAVSTINSDSDELVRHLYHEAAKSVRYAGMDPVRSLRLCTLNAAIQLGVDDRVGSIEQGKDADLVLLDADPLSVYSKVLWTMVDGEIEFQRRDAFALDEEPLVAKTLAPVSGAVEAAYDPDDGEVLAIVGGTIHPVTAAPIEDGTLLVQRGRIVALGNDLPVPAGARVVDADGLHVWPGMIALNATLGLREIGSVRGTIDSSEIGGNQPDLRVTTALHASSSHLGVTRTNGVTRSQTAPQSTGPMRGQSSILRLEGDTWEELVQVDRDMLHIRFPRVSNTAKKKEEPEDVETMRALLADAREYDRLSTEAASAGMPGPPFDPRLDALLPYVRGDRKVALHASNAQTILYALKFAEDEELDVVLYGATEAWKVVDAIARAGVPVVTGPVLKTPSSRYAPYDAPYSNPAVLHRAGVPFALMAQDNDNARNTPFQAGFAAAFGLPREEALRAVTLYPAQILDIDDRLGSLTVGKLADVVVTDGDLLEATTRVVHVLIDGEPVDVKNRQTRLYEQWRERLHEKQAAK